MAALAKIISALAALADRQKALAESQLKLFQGPALAYFLTEGQKL
jgi:hypothetical protein